MEIEAILRATGTYRWGHVNDAGKVQIQRNDVRLPRLPKAFDGFTILHLSDLHADMSAPALDRVAQLTLGLEYDLCVLTGDYRGRTYGDYKPCLEGVARLREVLHADVYAVLGNHDSIAMVPDLEALGIRMLLNESVAIERDTVSIYFAGVDDAHFYHTDDIEKAAAHIPKGSTKILLSHTPEIYGKVANAGFDLMLSGHTHGEGRFARPAAFPDPSGSRSAARPRRWRVATRWHGGLHVRGSGVLSQIRCASTIVRKSRCTGSCSAASRPEGATSAPGSAERHSRLSGAPWKTLGLPLPTAPRPSFRPSSDCTARPRIIL